MRELTQVCGAVTAALNQAGLTALAAFPAERARDYPGAVATVSVGAAEGGALGFCNYLGTVYDRDLGTEREVYGKQLEAAILVDIRAAGAADCEAGCAAAAEVLLGGLPAGIRSGDLAWEAIGWERSTGLFLRRGRLNCRAVFEARSDGDGETFLNFQLKGVLQS